VCSTQRRFLGSDHLAITTLAEPSRMYRYPSAIATLPLAQLLELVVPTPRSPNSLRHYNERIRRRPATRAFGELILGPLLTKALCCTSAFETPPSAVPKLTRTRSCGLSAEYSNPLSRRASWAEATANWAYRSNRFNRCGGKYSSGFHFARTYGLEDRRIKP